MLARITGILEQIEGNTALIALPGLDGSATAYHVMLPTYLAVDLASRLGAPVTLHTIQLFEQQAQGASFVPRLIGFASVEERRFFEVFTTVKGIGAKRALRALAVAPGEVARAITLRDTPALVRLPEIGKRLAETVIAELHGKVEAFAAASPTGAGAGRTGPSSGFETDPVRRAIAALMRLGETEVQAQTLVRRAAEVDASLASADELVAAALGQR
jgi:Holliday junction DNA helicase RuvA